MRAFAVLAVVFAVLATPALGAERMWIGFHDDPVLRFLPDRQAELDLVRQNNATIVRTLVTWRSIAPQRPANASNPFDRAYRFDDLDEFVRNAQARGLEVLMTIWGTPGWANGDKAAQFLPRNTNDFKNFCRALASRYSGRYAGYPFVRFYGIWNESNLGNFLSPQFDSKGKIVSPAAYAKLAAAGYSGLKAGSSKALVAIGETSSHGRDRVLQGTTDTTAPATFMKGVAKANKKLKFDAWAHHPYPFPVALPPAQKVRYPNVMLSTMPQFEQDLDKAFGRKNIPVWITEYGHETKPGEPKGVTESQQASYLPQAIATAKKDKRVQLFVWFVFRDSPSSLWQSGIYRRTGAAKPARAKWASAAKPLDMVNGKVTVKGGTKNPTVTVYLREFCVNNPIGAVVGANIRTSLGSTAVQNSQASAPLAVDCTIPVRLTGLTVAKGKTYTAVIDANTVLGSAARRTVTVTGT
ncbi:MAG TPA: cellulase family glycosylhydrolase [Gaiellaceae bacterium]